VFFNKVWSIPYPRHLLSWCKMFCQILSTIYNKSLNGCHNLLPGSINFSDYYFLLSYRLIFDDKSEECSNVRTNVRHKVIEKQWNIKLGLKLTCLLCKNMSTGSLS
jgi:hypothetical protein